MNDMQPVGQTVATMRALEDGKPLSRGRTDWVELSDDSSSYRPRMQMARRRPMRHQVAKLSFFLCVVIPVIVTIAYLYGRAADQFHSEFAFSVRSEDHAVPEIGLLGAITQISQGSAADADVLNEYIRSQKMVEVVDARVDLRTLYGKAVTDPVFGLGVEASPEDLFRYWGRMVDVTYDGHAGTIHVRSDAFAPEDAKLIAEAIMEESSALVNALSEQARLDAVQYAEADLHEAQAHLRDQRLRLAEFRAEYKLVDPAVEAVGQSGLLNALQTQLAEALVERDTLRSYASDDDQRVVQVSRRIDAVAERIAQERTRLGIGGVDVIATDILGEYEALQTDLEFAQTAYMQSLTNMALARATARRQSRYLAPHIEPTLASTALYPRRAMLSGLSALFLLLIWSAGMIFYYNIRDSR